MKFSNRRILSTIPFIVLALSISVANVYAASDRYLAGVAAMQSNDFQMAISNFDQAVTNDATDWGSFLKRGQCLYQLGDYKLAIADFNQVIALKPKNTDAILWRANSYAKLGQSDKALNDYKLALSIDPIKLAIISQKATFTSTRQSIPDGDDSVPGTASSATSNSSTTNANISSASSSSSSTASTATSSTSATSINAPDSTTAAAPAPVVLHLRPALFASGSDPGKDVTELSAAISLDPKNPQLLFKRARAYIQLKKNDNAINDLSDAIMNNPNNASFYLARALVYHLLGNDVLGDEDIRQAQFCDPGLPKKIDFENTTKK